MKKISLFIDCQQWAKALNLLATVVPTKAALPILSDVMLSRDKERNVFIMTVSDSESWLQMDCLDRQGQPFIRLSPEDIKADFERVCIGFRDLKESVASLPTANPLEVTFDYDSRVMRINYQIGEFTMPFEPADEFPKAQEIITKEGIDSGQQTKEMGEPVLRSTMQAEQLLPYMKQAYTCTANDELRPVMNAVALDCFADKVVIVASDGHCMYRRTLDTGVGYLDYQTFPATSSATLLVPKTVMKTLTAAFTDGDVTLTADTQRMKWQGNGITLTCRLIEGRYPNYNSVIPQNPPHQVTLCRNSLKGALRRLSLFANESSNMGILRREGNQINIEASDYDFSRAANERIAIVTDGVTPLPEGFAIGFKIATLLELLDLTQTDNIVLHLSDPSRAALITEEDKASSVVLLIMPMLVNDAPST